MMKLLTLDSPEVVENAKELTPDELQHISGGTQAFGAADFGPQAFGATEFGAIDFGA